MRTTSILTRDTLELNYMTQVNDDTKVTSNCFNQTGVHNLESCF